MRLQTAAGDKPLKLLCGNTSTGPWGPDDSTEVFVDISAVAELAGVEMGEAGLVAGSTTTISQLMAALSANAAASASYPVLVDHMKKVANWQVRNVGSWAGNLVMAKTKHFSSDIATLLMGQPPPPLPSASAGSRPKLTMYVGLQVRARRSRFSPAARPRRWT